MSGRPLVHILIAVLAWLLFGFYWWLVSRRQLSVETLDALLLLVLVVGGIWALTSLWMWHNVRRYRGRDGRRTRPRPRPEGPDLAHDHLGRTVETVGDLPPQQARYVVVRVEGDRKQLDTTRDPSELRE